MSKIKEIEARVKSLPMSWASYRYEDYLGEEHCETEFFLRHCARVIKLGRSKDQKSLEELEAIKELLVNAHTDLHILLCEVDVLATQIDILNRENAKLKEHCDGWHTAAMRAGVALMKHIKEEKP